MADGRCDGQTEMVVGMLYEGSQTFPISERSYARLKQIRPASSSGRQIRRRGHDAATVESAKLEDKLSEAALAILGLTSFQIIRLSEPGRAWIGTCFDGAGREGLDRRSAG